MFQHISIFIALHCIQENLFLCSIPVETTQSASSIIIVLQAHEQFRIHGTVETCQNQPRYDKSPPMYLDSPHPCLISPILPELGTRFFLRSDRQMSYSHTRAGFYQEFSRLFLGRFALCAMDQTLPRSQIALILHRLPMSYHSNADVTLRMPSRTRKIRLRSPR